MARRQWFDVPATDSPLAAALLNDLEARKPELAWMVINVKEPPYNAVGDGITDDTIAIQAAIDALPVVAAGATTAGGTIFFPPGDYRTSAALNLNGKYNITLLGSGSSWGGTRITPTTATTTAITARSSLGFRLEKLAVVVLDNAWTGTLIDLTGGVFNASDTSLWEISNCHLNAPAVSGSTVTHMILPQATEGTIRRNFFRGGSVAIRGRTVSGDYSNIMKIEDNLFAFLDVAGILNPWFTWNIVGNTFEPLRGGTAGGIVNAATIGAQGVNLIGNWFGDASASGSWVDMFGSAITVIGNSFDVGGTGFKLSANSTGVTIIGNRYNGLTTGNNLAGSHSSVHIAGNRYTSVTTPISGTALGLGSLVVDVDTDLTRIGANQLQTNSQLWLSGTAAGILIQSLTASSQFIVNVRQTGDTQDRWTVTGRGTMAFGSGSAAADTNLLRNTGLGGLDLDNTLRITTAGKGIEIKEGTNARQGASTLVAGTVTVSTTAVTANSRIFLSGQTSSGTHGELTVSARTAGTSFVITSSNAADTRLVAWEIFEPAP